MLLFEAHLDLALKAIELMGHIERLGMTIDTTHFSDVAF